MTLANEHSYFPTPFFFLLAPTTTVLRPFSPCFATLWPRFGPISLLRLAPHLLVVCPASQICLYVQSVCFLSFLCTIQPIKFFLRTTNLLIVIIRTTRIMAFTARTGFKFCIWYRLECSVRTKKHKPMKEIFRNNLYQTHRPDLVEKCDRLIYLFIYFLAFRFSCRLVVKKRNIF